MGLFEKNRIIKRETYTYSMKSLLLKYVLIFLILGFIIYRIMK